MGDDPLSAFGTYKRGSSFLIDELQIYGISAEPGSKLQVESPQVAVVTRDVCKRLFAYVYPSAVEIMPVLVSFKVGPFGSVHKRRNIRNECDTRCNI